MRVSNIVVLFTPRSCLDCAHFKPIIVGGVSKDFGKCAVYFDEDTNRHGYANGARIDQSKCGPGAVWFSPKVKKVVYIAENEPS